MAWFYLIPLIIPFITLKRKKKLQTSVSLDKTSVTCIKGFLCILAILYFLGTSLNQELSWFASQLVTSSGAMAAGGFLFFSAYGLSKSYEEKGNKFLLKLCFINVVKIYLTSVLINFLLYIFFFSGDGYTKTEVLLKIFNLDLNNPINQFSYFLYTIVICYVLFIFVNLISNIFKRNVKRYFSGILLILAPIVLFGLSLYFDFYSAYANQLFCFSLGVIYYLFADKINKVVVKAFTHLLVTFLLGLIASILLLPIISSILLILIFILIFLKFDFDNKTMFCLGKVSFFVYVIIYMSTLLWGKLNLNVFLWVILNAVTIYLSAIILYGFSGTFDEIYLSILRSLKRLFGIKIEEKD